MVFTAWDLIFWTAISSDKWYQRYHPFMQFRRDAKELLWIN